MLDSETWRTDTSRMLKHDIDIIGLFDTVYRHNSTLNVNKYSFKQTFQSGNLRSRQARNLHSMPSPRSVSVRTYVLKRKLRKLRKQVWFEIHVTRTNLSFTQVLFSIKSGTVSYTHRVLVLNQRRI